MANTYKNAFFDLTTTSKTDIYTCPAETTSLVRTIQVTNHAGSNPELEVFVYDASASTEYEISHSVFSSKTYQNMITHTLVLEAGDILKMQANTANAMKGFISTLEIDF